MSDKNMTRRTAIQVFFAGVNITASLQKYLLSLTYTDNEEDETDDLQIKLHDREGLWVEKWLNTAIQAAATVSTTKKSSKKSSSSGESNLATYKVVAKDGLAVRSRAGDQYYQYGTLSYGAVISVIEIKDGWANFTYSGKNAYCNASYLKMVSSGGTSTSSSSKTTKNSEEETEDYKVTATSGVAVRSRADDQYYQYGTLAYGTVIAVKDITDGWANFTYSGKNAYCKASCLQAVSSGSGSSSSATGSTEKGLRIQAVIVRQNWNGDGKDETLECGQFELDSVTAQGPPNTVTIKGTSLPYSSSVRQTEKSKSWESYTLSGICDEIASKNGMTCMFLSGENPSYNRVEQYKTSDIAFLQKLCHDAGCSLKVSNNILIVFDQADYEQKPEVLTITRGSGYTNYKLSTGSNDTYTSCRVSYTAPDGSIISATAYIDEYNADDENNQCLKIYQKVSSVAEAKKLAEKMLRLYNKYELQASFTFPGNPALLAGCTVILSGWGAWNGKYIIKQAKHQVSSSGYTTQITLRTALAAKA